MKKIFKFLILVMFTTFFATLTPSITNAASSYVSTKYYGYNSNQSITVNFSGASSNDWIGIYKRNTVPSGKPCDAALAWKYVTGSGYVTFYPDDFKNSSYSPQKGNYLEPGDYKIVLLKNNGYTVAAQSNFEIYGGNPLYSFQVLSDIHITKDGRCNVNLDRALKDINKFNPTSSNDSNSFLVIAGDSVDDIKGYPDLEKTFIGTNQYLLSNYNQKVPFIFSTLGNHELYDTVGVNSSSYEDKLSSFQQTFDRINKSISRKTSNNDTHTSGKPYYDAVVNGNHFIFLGSQSQASSIDADLHNDQLEWLDNKLWHIQNEEGDVPVFVFCHQGLPKTVAGTYPLPDRENGWSGIIQRDALKFILNKYPNVFYFSGHSHWNLSSSNTMYQEPKATYGNGIGATLFNTGSVTNLWSDNNTYMDGSQGYQVDVYNDKVVVRGRDFLNSKWIPEARFSVDLKPKYDSLHQIY